MMTKAISTVAGYATLLTVIFLFPAVSQAALTETCLTGTAPDVANDASQIRAVRSLIDEICVCGNFDGSKGQTHSNYVGCAAGIVAAEVNAAALRSQCKKTVKRYYSNSTCGRNPNQHTEPCIQMNLSTAKITCVIKATTKKDGVTPVHACSDTAKATRVACASYTHCIDAADTNGDLIIGGPGDSGSCAASPAGTPTNTPAVTPTNNPTDTATPTATPTAKSNGQACVQNSECATGFCVDGVCCNSACSGVCQACSAAMNGGTDGSCSATKPGFADLGCPAQGASTCGTTGNCDGTGSCQLWPNGTVCVAQSCSGSTLTKASTCNGAGTCSAPVPPTQSCSPYVCGGAACKTNCTSDADCVSGDYCQNPGVSGTCHAPSAAGATCSANNQCSSGICGVSGTGHCCAAACATGGICGASDCNAAGACVYPNSATSCAAPSCSGTVFTPAGTCNGTGSCLTGASTDCAAMGKSCNPASGCV